MQPQNTLGLFVACAILPLATAVGPSGLTQPGAPADCILWYSAEEGDTASTIAAAHEIPLETFMDANPQLSGDPLALWKGYNYCISKGQKIPLTKGSDNYYPISNSTTGNPPVGSGTGLIGGRSSYTDEIDSTYKESSVTTKDSTTLIQSTQYPETVTDSQSTTGFVSHASSQSTTSSDPSTVSQPTTSSESSKPPELNTATQASDKSRNSESEYASATQTTATNTAPPDSTTTLAIPAPTKHEYGAESGTQSGTHSETQDAGNEGSGALAESFEAIPRDLDEARQRVGGKFGVHG